MNDAHTLAELFLHVVLFVLPRDSFDGDRCALLRLSRIRKNLVEQMHECSGAFTLDLHLSAVNVVMMAPYPSSALAYFDTARFDALKNTASRFRSVGRLCIDLAQLPARCNFVHTPQILDLVAHCLTRGRAKHLHISHASFDADRFASCMSHLFQYTKNQILSVDLRHCKLAINSQFMRELASMRNLASLTLDGNKFHLVHSPFPSFSDKLESLSLADCGGIRPSILQHVGKTLRTLVWSENAIEEADKPAFLAWIADSHLRNLDIDNCGFCQDDACEFQRAVARMPALRSLSMAGNEFQSSVVWWLHEMQSAGRTPALFSVHISNMHICYPEACRPVIMASTRFGRIEILEWDLFE